MGRVAGQSKQIVLAGIFFNLRNWAFLSLDGMQTCPFPAAVMDPSAWMLPEFVVDMIVMLGRIIY